MSATPDPVIPVLVDGWLYNPETGEVMRPLAPQGNAHSWLPEDVKGVEWVLERMGEVEAEILALKARKKMIIANIDTMIKREESKIGALRHFYTAACAQVVAPLMGKLKSWTCPFGKIRLASTKTKIEILDEQSAVSYLKTMEEDEALKLSVLKSKISDALAQSLLEHPDIAKQYGFGVTPGETAFVLEAKLPTTGDPEDA